MPLTAHQEIFKPKPKVIRTPLHPVKPAKVITPLSGKQEEPKKRNRLLKEAAPDSQEETTP